MKRFLCLLTAFTLFLTLCLPVKADTAGEKNIALKCPVTSSGYIKPDGAEDSEKDTCINDGNPNTKWCARIEDYLNDGKPETAVSIDKFTSDGGHWVCIDLGKEYPINGFKINQASTGDRDKGRTDFNMKQYAVEVSTDNKNWLPVTEEDNLNLDEGIIERTVDPPMMGRWFKLSTYAPASGVPTVRLYELEVYAADPSSITAGSTASTGGNPDNTVARNTPMPVNDDNQGKGISPWVIIIPAAVIVIAGGVTGFVILKKKRK